MRIVFFSPHSDPLAQLGEPDSGGQCVYEERVTSAFANIGHEVRIYTRLYGDKKEHDTIREGAEIFRFAAGPEGFLRKEDMGPYLTDFTHRVIEDQRDWLETADVFHGHYWDGGVSALEASLAFGKTLAFTSHSLGILKRDRVTDPNSDGSMYRYSIRIPAERRVMHAADYVIALSEVEREAITNRYGIDGTKIKVVPGGVDIESFAPKADKVQLKKQLGIETDFMAFTVGRLDPRKGFIELISAIPHVVNALQKTGQTVTFLIPAGPTKLSLDEANYKRALEEKASSLGVSQYIRWFNRLSDNDLRLHLAAADVFICASPYEPFGLIIVESFASGTPVVATCHGGPTEIVTPGEDGYLAEPGDTKAFANGIVELLNAEESRRAKMGQAAMEKARTRYAWVAIATQIADVYAGAV